jgi:regulator of sigma E protease
MVFFENIWWLLVLIGVMIIIHELGHYWAARFFDVCIETFSFGFGPRLFGFRKGETDFRFSLILFGGYVKMLGEQPGEEGGDDPRSFLAKPRWQRLIIAFAGPFMNIILAVALLTGLFMFKYPKPPESSLAGMIGYVVADSAAGRAGIQAGDRIVAIDGSEEPSWDDILMKEFASAGQAMSVQIDRGGQQLSYEITPILDEKTGVGFAGWAEEREILIAGLLEGIEGASDAGLKPGDTLVSINGKAVRSVATLNEVIKESKGESVEIIYSRDGLRNQASVKPKLSTLEGEERYMIGISLREKVVFTQLSLPDAFAQSVNHNIRSATLIFRFLEGLIERRMSPKSLEGPIRIAQLSGDAARQGAYAFIGLMAMVSLNLAVFNLLPIPILDGGVILMLLVEIVMGRDLSMPVKEGVIKVGFIFLMVIVVFVIYNDIQKVIPSGG